MTDALPFVVWCWNADHTARKFFKDYVDQAQAVIDAAALKRHGIEAEVEARDVEQA